MAPAPRAGLPFGTSFAFVLFFLIAVAFSILRLNTFRNSFNLLGIYFIMCRRIEKA